LEIEKLKIELESKNSRIEELENENSTLNSFTETQQQYIDTIQLRCIESETGTEKKLPQKIPTLRIFRKKMSENRFPHRS